MFFFHDVHLHVHTLNKKFGCCLEECFIPKPSPSETAHVTLTLLHYWQKINFFSPSSFSSAQKYDLHKNKPFIIIIIENSTSASTLSVILILSPPPYTEGYCSIICFFFLLYFFSNGERPMGILCRELVSVHKVALSLCRFLTHSYKL